jgi:ABC-2 type transport system ATP-binding protein
MEDLNLTIPSGCIMGLVGENGAGKTTLIKLLLNIIKREKGSIKIFGKDNIEDEKLIKEDIGVVLDNAFFADTMKTTDIIKIMSNIYKNWDTLAYEKYLETFNLPKDKIIKEFSAGMKMKLKIAVALSHNPKLLILDEPTSGLDPIVRTEILDIFLDFIQDEGKSILFSTHITTDLEHIADYITFIHKGSILLNESRDNLLDNYVIAKCDEETYKQIDSKDVIRYRKNKYNYELLIDNKNQFNKKYPKITLDKATIEDIMVLYIKGMEE